MIYPVDSAIQRLNNRPQHSNVMFRCQNLIGCQHHHIVRSTLLAPATHIQTDKATKPQRYICLDHWHKLWAIFFLTRENEHFEHIDSTTILSLQKSSGSWDWISIFACSPKVNSEPLIYIFHPSIDSIPVNSFEQEGYVRHQHQRLIFFATFN